MKGTIGLLVAAMIGLAQTSEGLRQRYGAPISETYIVGKDLRATVNYSKNRQVCSIGITSQPSLPLSGKSGSGTYLKAQVEDKQFIELANELVPLGQRGRLVSSGLMNTDSPEIDDVYHGGYES